MWSLIFVECVCHGLSCPCFVSVVVLCSSLYRLMVLEIFCGLLPERFVLYKLYRAATSLPCLNHKALNYTLSVMKTAAKQRLVDDVNRRHHRRRARKCSSLPSTRRRTWRSWRRRRGRGAPRWPPWRARSSCRGAVVSAKCSRSPL